ncbi:MAG TPA: GNAT family N-acetyltransferase [Caulobacteraceae bacterium]|nr:GNAT family N-acetyltransferase [Caulobacteraceae bacterium]
MNNPIRVRPATQDDCRVIWLWRNDPLTRAMSRMPDAVPWETHRAWFTKVLADPARTILVGEVAGDSVGMVRLDRGNETEVSIEIAPSQRGRGLGRALLEAALEGVAGRLVADVKTENTASRLLFERAGFVPDAPKSGLIRYRRG